MSKVYENYLVEKEYEEEYVNNCFDELYADLDKKRNEIYDLRIEEQKKQNYEWLLAVVVIGMAMGFWIGVSV